MSWLERLQTLVRGEVWRGEEQAEVQVNEGILRQFVSQGFPENAARVRPQSQCTRSHTTRRLVPGALVTGRGRTTKCQA